MAMTKKEQQVVDRNRNPGGPMQIQVSFLGCYFRDKGPSCRLPGGPKHCTRGEEKGWSVGCPLKNEKEIMIIKQEK